MRRLLTVSVVLASTLFGASASATDVQACLGASEKGQRARSAGKLREARDNFLICGGEGCPAMVRKDCAQWQGDVIAVIPSVVFGAKDKQGRDLFDVTVSMDGEVLAKKLDGKSVAVDPGPHTFKFEMAGAQPVTERALVKEGEKSRGITAMFGDGGGTAVENGTTTPPDADRTKPPSSGDKGHTVLPWIVVGVGAATMIFGVVWFATAPDTPEGCLKASQTCSKVPGESPTQFEKRQEEAGRADVQPLEGLIIGAAGLAVGAAGLVWHFLEPTNERTGSLRVTPWAAPGSAGGGFVGTF